MKISDAKIRSPSPALEKDASFGIKNNAATLFNERNKGEHYLLNIDQLIPFHNQSRLYFDETNIEELAKTIKTHGIRQPLTVIKSQKISDKYEIVSGERRYRAALRIGLNKLPCIILENIDSADEIALIENIQREDLHPIEMGRAYLLLYQNEKFNTHQKIAEKLGVPRSQVTEYMAYGNLSDEESLILIKNNISERRILRKIVSINNVEKRQNYINNLVFLSEEKPTETLPKNKRSSSSTLVSIYSKEGKIECKHASFEKMEQFEKKKLIEHLNEIIKALEI